MTPAQFLAMLDAATPEELREIARRIAPLVLHFPLAELPADAIQLEASLVREVLPWASSRSN